MRILMVTGTSRRTGRGDAREVIQAEAARLLSDAVAYQAMAQGENPYGARPAPWPRLERQLALASKYSDSGAAGFSVPEYLTPWGGPETYGSVTEYEFGASDLKIIRIIL